MTRGRTTVAAFLALVLSAVAAPAADAAFPGPNGRIAFAQSGDIWTANPDGTGLMNLTSSYGIGESGPVFSPDGRRIAFTAVDKVFVETAIYVMNSDGTDWRMVTPGPSAYPGCEISNGDVSWSPDGTQARCSPAPSSTTARFHGEPRWHRFRAPHRQRLPGRGARVVAGRHEDRLRCETQISGP